MKEKRPFFYTLKFAFVVALAAILIFLISYAFSHTLLSRNSSTSLPVLTKVTRYALLLTRVTAVRMQGRWQMTELSKRT